VAAAIEAGVDAVVIAGDVIERWGWIDPPSSAQRSIYIQRLARKLG